MKTITVHHWCSPIVEFRNTWCEHKAEYDYTDDLRNKIVDMAFEKGYNTMLYRVREDDLIIFIDTKRFQQR